MRQQLRAMQSRRAAAEARRNAEAAEAELGDLASNEPDGHVLTDAEALRVARILEAAARRREAGEAAKITRNAPHREQSAHRKRDAG